MSNFHPLEVVSCGSKTQLQVGENLPSKHKELTQSCFILGSPPATEETISIICSIIICISIEKQNVKSHRRITQDKFHRNEI